MHISVEEDLSFCDSDSMKSLAQLLASLMLLALTGTGNADARLSLAPGFSIETLPFAVPNARQMALTDAGTLIVGTRKKGRVYAVVNPFTDNPRVITLIKGLKMPSGVAVVGMICMSQRRLPYTKLPILISNCSPIRRQQLLLMLCPTNGIMAGNI